MGLPTNCLTSLGSVRADERPAEGSTSVVEVCAAVVGQQSDQMSCLLLWMPLIRYGLALTPMRQCLCGRDVGPVREGGRHLVWATIEEDG